MCVGCWCVLGSSASLCGREIQLAAPPSFTGITAPANAASARQTNHESSSERGVQFPKVVRPRSTYLARGTGGRGREGQLARSAQVPLRESFVLCFLALQHADVQHMTPNFPGTEWWFDILWTSMVDKRACLPPKAARAYCTEHLCAGCGTDLMAMRVLSSYKHNSDTIRYRKL